jgi:agmatine/peptidylarginine deiminase
MSNLLRYIPALFLLAATPLAQAQDEPWYDHDPLPQEMTGEEMLRRDEIGLGFAPTPPPTGPVRNIAEFERSEAVLIRYPLGITLQLVAALSEHVRVITIVASQTLQNQATSAFQGAGVNMANVEFLLAPTNSFWTRDYGPFYVFDGNRQFGIVDFIYNRPRPLDDVIPAALAAHMGVPLYAMDLVHTGGNYMTESRGASASTDLVLEENGFNQALVLDRMLDYLGVHTYHVLPDPQGEYIMHIDTWAKFLDVDKVLVAQVPTSDPRYEDYEAAADYFASQTSAYGTPYQVFRIYVPDDQPYTNAIIVNERVYVPVVNSQWDDDALAAYEAAMPGYEVLGFTGSWLSTDALHCRVKEIADPGLLYLRHQPVAGDVPYQPAIALDVDIVPYSGQPLIEDELHLIYRVEAAPFDTLALQHVGGDTYAASLPVPQGGDVEVSYYFSAADASGRTERFPLVGPAGARSFYVLPPSAVSVSAQPVNPPVVLPPQGGSFQFTVTLTNQSNQPQTFQAWTAVTGPVDRDPVLGPQAVTLPAGATVTRTLTQQVPANAPAGTYTYAVNLGDFPDVVLASDAFTLTKQAVEVTASAAAGGGPAVTWAVSGWEAAVAASSTEQPSGFALGEVYPNPFRGRAHLTLRVADAQAVSVEVFDALGRRVAVLHDGALEAGTHTLVLDGSVLPAGVYVVRAVGERVTAARSVAVLR